MSTLLDCLFIIATGSLILGWCLYHSCLKAKQKHAEKRTAALLHEVLTPDEYTYLLSQGYIDISSPRHPERTYRVPWTGTVQVRENNHVIMRLCLQSVKHLPKADMIVVHKLMINADEARYLQTANQFSSWLSHHPGPLSKRIFSSGVWINMVELSLPDKGISSEDISYASFLPLLTPIQTGSGNHTHQKV